MDVSVMATERLEAELVAHAAWESAGMARMLKVLAEFDRRQGWGLWECRSAQQWLSWKCGVGYVAATERLRVAKALEGLPVIDAAFTNGELSWSKVRALTRAATPETEVGLVDIARHATAQQVARLARTIRRVTPVQAVNQLAERSLRWATEDDGSVTITVRLPADRAVPAIEAIHAVVVPAAGVPRSQAAADALVDLLTGKIEPMRPEVILHVDGTGARFEDGQPVGDEIAESLACDGPVTTVLDTDAGPALLDTRRAPSKRQRRWLGLRHRTCQFPGCHHAGSFDAHHVIEHGKGGRTTISNLIRLCWFHHRAVHLHHLRLTLHPDRRLEVAFPAGNPVDRDVPVEAFLVPPPEDPDRVAGTWYGDRLDLNECLVGLGVVSGMPALQTGGQRRRSTCTPADGRVRDVSAP